MNVSGTQQDSVDHILSAWHLRSGLAAMVGLSTLLLAGTSAAQTAVSRPCRHRRPLPLPRSRPIRIRARSRFGAWNLHGGVEFQKLGDTTAFFNGDDDTQVIGSIGIGFTYVGARDVDRGNDRARAGDVRRDARLRHPV